MIKSVLAPIAAGLALMMPAPALAQEGSPEPEEMSSDAVAEMAGMFGSLFQADPLTPEQEARLPKSSQVVATIMPDGFYAKIMAKTIESTMEPLISMLSGTDMVLSSRLDVDPDTLETLSEDQKTELARLLDPAFDERAAAMFAGMTGGMSGMFNQMEPPMREGLSRAYAVRFTEAQLDDIAAFFATPTGSVYATESMALFADPQVMSATMQALPTMMGSFTDMGKTMEEAMAKLPPERAYADLSAGGKARMAELLGLPEGKLEAVVVPPKEKTGMFGEEG